MPAMDISRLSKPAGVPFPGSPSILFIQQPLEPVFSKA
jgi:hypothetical protein